MPTVYEFSRKLIPPEYSTRYNRYVSRGYDKEIGWRMGWGNYNVPTEIEEAVHRGDFRINDSYPPKEKTIALIAREIANYSILGVATSELDDGGRPLVAYRYFWIENSNDKSFDGVATLLWWWYKNNKPCFELIPESEWTSKDRSFLKNAQFCPKENLKSYAEKIQSYLPQISVTPYLISVSQVISNKTDVWQWHALALQLKESYNIPLAWAWNVPSLEYPQKFTLISCENNSAYQRILSEIGHPKSLSNIQRKSVNSSSHNPSLFTTQTQKNKSSINPDESIKKCLKDLASDKNLPDNFNKLVNYLGQNSSYHWDWERIIDKTFRDNNTEASFKYKALLVILNPDINPLEWLRELRRTKDSNLQKIVITIQAQFLAYSKKNTQFNTIIVQRMYDIVIRLLSALLESNQDYDIIKWLLVDSSKFLTETLKSNSWKKYCGDYAQFTVASLFYKIVAKDLGVISEIARPNDIFYKQLAQDIEQWEMYLQINLKILHYQNIAYIFREIKAFNLAALLYQMSQGSVPAEILDQCTDIVEIIPLDRGKAQANISSPDRGRNRS